MSLESWEVLWGSKRLAQWAVWVLVGKGRPPNLAETRDLLAALMLTGLEAPSHSRPTSLVSQRGWKDAHTVRAKTEFLGEGEEQI